MAVGRIFGAVCIVFSLGACMRAADPPPPDPVGGMDGSTTLPGAPPASPFLGMGDASDALRIDPVTATLLVDPTTGTPAAVQFTASGPNSSSAVWTVQNTTLGNIDQSGHFVASGRSGGETEIHAKIRDSILVAHLTVTIEYRQNGVTSSAVPDPGTGPSSGGIGGVGGDGVGGPVPEATVKVFDGNLTGDPTLHFLYPYDRTVFPLDVLPPLLQWTAGSNGTFDAVSMHVTVPGLFDYTGLLAKPASLAPSANFLRHPIPADVWERATATAAGKTMTVELLVSANGHAYGPLSQTYTIAPGKITGQIYYQAYNTALANNYSGAVGGDRFGGATLSIKIGALGPRLVAGKTTTDATGCRVCHSVSAYGDRMLVQQGDDYAASSTYDLKNGNTESSPYAKGAFSRGFVGLFPDGSLGLTNSAGIGGSIADENAALYDMATARPLAAPGLSEFATKIALPMFSPDGKHVAFTLFGGPSTPAVGPPTGRELVVMDFDASTKTFSNARKLWETGATAEHPAWPTFFPSSSAVVFMRHFQGTDNELFATRYGARGELWWADLATGSAAPLDALNGGSYVPKGPNNHDDDARLQFEPTISPVTSGGYASIVFMSRRLYGNVATVDPWWSDPREHDLQVDVTPKKLWMAALDLNPTPGTDPSHPAFYVPGQELHGLNSRPFFALDPCMKDGGACSTGVDCCAGYCIDGLCATEPPDRCSQTGDRCSGETDCCNEFDSCIGAVCSLVLR